MKNRIILLLIIIITATLASCAPTSKAEHDKTEYQNAATTQITATNTASCTPRPTITPTYTASPTLTLTAEPMVPLPELIQNLSPEETQEVLSLMQEQFPASKENDAYHFFCISGEPVKPELSTQLPTGEEVVVTLPCYYTDSEGIQQKIQIPITTFFKENLTQKKAGYRTKYLEDDEEAWTWRYEEVDVDMQAGWMWNAGWSEAGHVIYLNFAMPTAENDFAMWSEDGYFNEALQALMTAEQLEQFAQTGDPSLLPQTVSGEPLLLPVNISYENVFGNIQHRNYYEDAKND